jgi:hypothetical protein
MADEQTVRTSERVWSAECKQADPTPEDETAYVFSNGKKFKEGDGPYGVDE